RGDRLPLHRGHRHRRIVDDAVDDHVGDVVVHRHTIGREGGELVCELFLTRKLLFTAVGTERVGNHRGSFRQGQTPSSVSIAVLISQGFAAFRQKCIPWAWPGWSTRDGGRWRGAAHGGTIGPGNAASEGFHRPGAYPEAMLNPVPSTRPFS